MTVPKIYTKIGCPWCEDVKDFMNSKNFAFEEKVVTGDAALMDEMKKVSGQTKAPTMDWDGEILPDFGVDELKVFLKQKGVL